MPDALDPYRAKRDPRRTPEPVPAEAPDGDPHGGDPHGGRRFVIQQHHARSLHWDLRLERDGVFVSWAVPKGLPPAPGTNHLAVHVEDHPLEYGSFTGEIPRGEYGAGSVGIWDQGTYDADVWTDRDVKVTLHGNRVSGRYGLFRTKDQQWMIHRMDAVEGGYEPLPEFVPPMLATAGALPRHDEGWAYEFKWDGMRALVRSEGGRVHVRSRSGREVTAGFPELRAIGAKLGTAQALLDGEIVALDEQGRPSFEALQPRMHGSEDPKPRRSSSRAVVPVTFMIFDLLHFEGRSTLLLAYRDRRTLLEQLDLNGDTFVTAPSLQQQGAAVLAAASRNGLEGIVAKRLDSPYLSGRRADTWLKIKNFATQEVLIGGWSPGKGHRQGAIGALLVGVPHDKNLRFAGKVGTGFTEAALADLATRLAPLVRDRSPFDAPLPRADAAGATYVEPVLVGEVRFSEWTRAGRLRQPSWRGLRFDKPRDEIVVEPVEPRAPT